MVAKNDLRIVAPWPYNLLKALGKPNDCILNDDQERGVEYAISLLGDREQAIVLRYYKDGARQYQIGEEFGITQSRVGQIINKSLQKLRHASRYVYIERGYSGVSKIMSLTLLEADIEAKERELKARAKMLTMRQAELERVQENLDAWEIAIRQGKKAITGETQSIGMRPTIYASFADYKGLFNIPIDALDLSIRVWHRLNRAGLRTVGDCIESSEKDNLRVLKLGERGLEELQARILDLTGFDIFQDD